MLNFCCWQIKVKTRVESNTMTHYHPTIALQEELQAMLTLLWLPPMPVGCCIVAFDINLFLNQQHCYLCGKICHIANCYCCDTVVITLLAGTVATGWLLFFNILNNWTLLLAMPPPLKHCYHCIVYADFWCCCCLVIFFIFIKLAPLAGLRALPQCRCHCCSFAVANCRLLHRNTCGQCHCRSIMMLFPSINLQADTCCLVSWLLVLLFDVAACCNQQCCC